MRVWLLLVYKFTDNCQVYRLFSEFIQTQKSYPTSLGKMDILTLNSAVRNFTRKSAVDACMFSENFLLKQFIFSITE